LHSVHTILAIHNPSEQPPAVRGNVIGAVSPRRGKPERREHPGVSRILETQGHKTYLGRDVSRWRKLGAFSR